MSRVHEKQIAIARVYARAMLELAGEAEARERVVEELREVAAHAAGHHDFADFLASPLVDSADRAITIEKLFRGRLGDLVVDALQVINRKGRLALLPTIAAVSRDEDREMRGRIDARVRTAVPLDELLRSKLLRAVERLTGKQADLEESVEPELLGGMVLHVGDRKIDRSVRQELRGLAARLEERASREVLAAGDYFDVQGETG